MSRTSSAAQTDKLIEDRCKFRWYRQCRIQSVKVELKADIGCVNAKVMEASDEIHDIKTQLDKVTGELKADVLDLQEQGLKAGDEETTALKAGAGHRTAGGDEEDDPARSKKN